MSAWVPSSARGSWAALEASLRPYVSRKVRSPADVDDVLQETWLRLHRGAPALDDPARFGPWVHTVLRRVLVDHHRARARNPLAGCEAPDVATPADDDGRDLACAPQGMRMLVDLLPEVYREALTLTELEGLTVAEAAARAGVPLPTMKSRVQRGRVKLRGWVEAACQVTLDGGGRVMACVPRGEGCCAPPGTTQG